MQPETIVFYKSYYDAISDLPEKLQLKVYQTIFSYVFSGEELELIGLQKTLWTLIKPTLEANIRNYENGKKGGRPKKGVSENKKGGFLKNKTSGFEKTITNKDVNYNVNYNLDKDVNSPDVEPPNQKPFSGKTADAKTVADWCKTLGIMQTTELEKMAILELKALGCIPSDAYAARLENPKYFGRLDNEHTRRLIVTEKDIREKKAKEPKKRGWAF